jgi:hypothetical protein
MDKKKINFIKIEKYIISKKYKKKFKKTLLKKNKNTIRKERN